MDDDIDPTKLSDVVWAIATRVHHTDRRVVFDAQRVVRLPQLYVEEEYQARSGPKMVYGALQSAIGDGRHLHSSFDQAYSERLKQKVIHNWPV